MKEENLIVPDDVVMSRIYLVRGKKAMLGREVAALFGVERDFAFQWQYIPFHSAGKLHHQRKTPSESL